MMSENEMLFGRLEIECIEIRGYHTRGAKGSQRKRERERRPLFTRSPQSACG